MEELKKCPAVSILMPSWNGKANTLECLDSIEKLDYPKNKLEIIVSDNGSIDGSVTAIKKKFKEMEGNLYFGLKIIDNKENIGATGALNKAYEAANIESEFILKLDNDVVLAPDSLKKSVMEMESDKKIGLLGGEIHFYDKPSAVTHSAFFVDLYKGKNKIILSSKKIICDYVTGCFSLIRKKCIGDVFLDNDYFVYYDDTDLCFRIKKRGYKILYLPEIKIYHKVSASTGGKKRSSFFVYYYTRNRLLFIHRHANIFQKLFFFTIYLFIGVPLFIFRSIFIWNKNINFQEIKVFLKAVKDGFLNRGGK